MKSFQMLIKQLPEWVIILYLFLSLSVVPLLVFNFKWKQTGVIKEAFISCSPLFLALGALGAIIAFLYYFEEKL